MIRNLPNNISREGLVSILNTYGFRACFDFLYLPIDFDSGASLGYAFVNFVSGADALRFMASFLGFNSWPGQSTSKKVMQVQWSRDDQGLDAHIARYRDTPLMHESVPEECRPMLLKDGVQIAFPEPTKPIRKPRFRTNHPKRVCGGAKRPANRRQVKA